jgi:hypothetical protein
MLNYVPILQLKLSKLVQELNKYKELQNHAFPNHSGSFSVLSVGNTINFGKNYLL